MDLYPGPQGMKTGNNPGASLVNNKRVNNLEMTGDKSAIYRYHIDTNVKKQTTPLAL